MGASAASTPSSDRTDGPPAERPAGSLDDDELDFTVGGDVIKFMWDYGVVVPLWDGNGLVPAEHEWLRTALCLSDALLGDLSQWGTT